ncbi:MAG: hypothetical protein O7J95_03130, partial [Planctomycetota bacterium]|nr:hypothetical protein [Planctomycetota bacterium]
SPPAGGTRAGTGNGAPRPPGRVPQSAAPLTISAPDAPFPGRIDEVKLIRRLEHLRFTHAEGQKIVGWRKEIRFDRRGHLDPAHHEGGVRIVLVELDDDDPGAGDESSSRTAPSVDYSLRFDQWLERSRPPTARWARTAAASATSASPSGSEPTQEEEEAKIEARYRTHRTAVVVVDLLGVVR